MPDELLVEMVLEDVLGPDSPPTYVLDGFPRTLVQAQAAYERAISTDRSCTTSSAWTSARRSWWHGCASAGRTTAGRTTTRRRCGTGSWSTNRRTCRCKTGRGLLVRIDGSGEVDEVTARILAALAARGARAAG